MREAERMEKESAQRESDSERKKKKKEKKERKERVGRLRKDAGISVRLGHRRCGGGKARRRCLRWPTANFGISSNNREEDQRNSPGVPPRRGMYAPSLLPAHSRP